jgi:hypothetical protein
MVTTRGRRSVRPARVASLGPGHEGRFPTASASRLGQAKVKSLMLGRHHALLLAVTDRQGPFAPVRTSYTGREVSEALVPGTARTPDTLHRSNTLPEYFRRSGGWHRGRRRTDEPRP